MDMDYIDIDQVYDVPDTPDRVVSNDKTNKGRVEIEIDSSASANSKYTHVFGEGSRNQARGKSKLIIDDGLNKRLSFDPIRGPGISKRFDEGLKSPSTKSSTYKNAHMFRKAMMDGPSNPGNRLSLNSQRKLKGISPPTSQSSPSREKTVLDLTKHSGRTQIFGMAPSKENSNSVCAPNTYKGKEKIDVKGSFGDNAISPPRVRGLKRLVKNGVISPHNIVKGKQIAENNSNGSTAVQSEVGSHVSESDCSLDLMRELVSDDHNSRRGRGLKSNLVLPVGADTKNMSSRQCVTHTKDASKTSTSVRDALRSFDGIGGWRNTHTLKVNPPFPAEEKHMNQQNERFDLRRLNRVGSSPLSSTLVKRHKQGSSSSNAGGSSSFASIDSDIVVLGSSKEASNVRSKRNMNSNGVGTSSSFIEIDELSPDMRCGESTSRACNSNDDSYAKAMQLEADEMLALELQEQMYNEISQVGNREIDAHIALALQEEETSEQAFDSTSLPVFRPRDRVTSNTNRRSQSRPSQNPSARSTTRARSSTPSRLTRLRSQYAGRAPRIPVGRRNSGFPSNMDLDTRMHILEALEAFSDMGVASNAFQVDRDFNENDYEMLLRLDENNHQHAGASVRLIDRLPQSTVQNDNTEDCAVCLEKPSIGDVIRHLPCLHKFHKDCIDPWLRRNTSCPVCKSSVT